MAVVAAVLMILLTTSDYGTSQLTNNNSSRSSREVNVNTPIRLFCGRNTAMSSASFFSILNSTIAEMRSQLSSEGVYFAKAQNVKSGDSVYGLSQCRRYLSTDQCVGCFDAAVSAVRTCSSVNGANVFLDNCFLRYENFDEFYDSPQTTMDVGAAPTGICNNQSSSQPTTNFNQFVGDLLSDIQVATPRTANFYVASTRQIPSDETIIYAIGQCVENTSPSICESCMNTTSVVEFARRLLGGSSSKLGIIAGACVGVGLILLIITLIVWYKLRTKPKAEEAFHQTWNEPQFQEFKNYRYEDLRLATHDFGAEYRVGKGGYGEVYKAILEDETTVAVKKLHASSSIANQEFKKELALISSVRHRNLMQLLGLSTDGPELLLVLEYMPQGSLDKFLWGVKRGSLNWGQRFDIIFGIARGLAHLHKESHVKIIHRDIKSNNILLDDHFQPKIADFGVARFQSDDQSHVTTQFAGTLGYTAPEYAIYGQLSDKVDTYSFGIVTLEIISGRRCTDVSFDGDDTHYLLQHAWELYEKRIHIELIDDALDLEEYEEHVTKIIEIALKCTQSPATSRPSMSEVVLMLSSWRSFVPTQITRPTIANMDRRIMK